jgi:hypothetical protein
MEVAHAIKMFQVALDKGWLKPDDEIIVRWWSFEDVLGFVEGDDYYGDVTDEVAREVWAEVVDATDGYEYVDNDVVRDEISSVLDKRMEGK